MDSLEQIIRSILKSLNLNASVYIDEENDLFPENNIMSFYEPESNTFYFFTNHIEDFYESYDFGPMSVEDFTTCLTYYTAGYKQASVHTLSEILDDIRTTLLHANDTESVDVFEFKSRINALLVSRNAIVKRVDASAFDFGASAIPYKGIYTYFRNEFEPFVDDLRFTFDQYVMQAAQELIIFDFLGHCEDLGFSYMVSPSWSSGLSVSVYSVLSEDELSELESKEDPDSLDQNLDKPIVRFIMSVETDSFRVEYPKEVEPDHKLIGALVEQFTKLTTYQPAVEVV